MQPAKPAQDWTPILPTMRRQPTRWRPGMEAEMKAAIWVASAAFILTIASVSAAQAGSWTTRWTGPRGGIYEGSGSCDSGTCQRSGTFTGPYGGVWRHSGNAHQVAPGQWAGEGSIVGPGGGRWQHSWTWHNGGS